jgi:hypothetical protein
MTKQEFIKAYARRSHVTVEWILARRDAYPCDCGEEGCEGWQMLSPENAEDARKLGQIPER